MSEAEQLTPRALDLDSITLLSGGHTENDDYQMCVMEAVAYVAGENWSDHPQCASPTIGAFMRATNDKMGDKQRQLLKPYVVKLVGSKASDEVETERRWMAADWAIRECLPWMFEKIGDEKRAAEFRALEPVDGKNWHVQHGKAIEAEKEYRKKATNAYATNAAYTAANAYATANAAAYATTNAAYTAAYTAAAANAYANANAAAAYAANAYATTNAAAAAAANAYATTNANAYATNANAANANAAAAANAYATTNAAYTAANANAANANAAAAAEIWPMALRLVDRMLEVGK